jgi:hypothetical protein
MTNVRNQPSRFTAWRLFVVLEAANRDRPLRDFCRRFLESNLWLSAHFLKTSYEDLDLRLLLRVALL